MHGCIIKDQRTEYLLLNNKLNTHGVIMMKRLMVVVMACAMMASTAFAANPVKLPATLKAGDSDLVLNGSGVRTKFFIEAYTAGLYVPAKTKDVASVMNTDGKAAIKLHITSKMITSKKMSDATMEGFEKSTKGNIAPLKKEIDEMISVFSAEIKLDDVYDMVYEPGKGTSIFKNGKLAKTIKGEAFKKALFGIWLGADPVQADLKAKLAGA